MSRTAMSRFNAALVRRTFVLWTILLAITSTGCSSVFTSEPVERLPANNTLEVDVFAARGFLGGTDYEQYKLSSGVMWRECGSIAGKKSALDIDNPDPSNSEASAKNSADVFRPDSSLQPQERRVEELTKEELLELTNEAARVIQTRETTTQPLPAPGSLFSLVQPGLVELAVSMDGKKHRFITSVDALAEQNLPMLQKLNKLYSRIRSIGKPICNSRSFYGISRASS